MMASVVSPVMYPLKSTSAYQIPSIKKTQNFKVTVREHSIYAGWIQNAEMKITKVSQTAFISFTPLNNIRECNLCFLLLFLRQNNLLGICVDSPKWILPKIF